MLRGRRVVLRAPAPDDVAFLHELWAEVDTWLLGKSRPYLPESLARKTRQHQASLEGPPDPGNVWMVVEADGRAAGLAGLGGIDLHNRRADVAVTLGPAARGVGHGSDALGVLCHYGFRLRGLHRLQAETLVTNVAMQRTAESVGFVREGVLRGRDWQPSGWCDVVVYGLLAEGWSG